jgi:hypothetical protein
MRMDKEEQFASRKFHPEVKYFLDTSKIRGICGGLERSKMASHAMESPTQAAGYIKSVAE